jgi:hypothetical protein
VGTTKLVIAIPIRRQNDRVVATGVVMNLHHLYRGNSPFAIVNLDNENASQSAVYRHRGVSSASLHHLLTALCNGRILHYPASQSSVQPPHHERPSSENPHPHHGYFPDATTRRFQYEIRSAELRLPDLQRENGTGTEIANRP